MKITNLKLKIIVMVILGLFGFWGVTVVQAQGLSLSLWPPLLEVTVQPGKSITQVYKISNLGDTDLVITSSIVPIQSADEEGNIINGLPADAAHQALQAGQPAGQQSSASFFSFQNLDIALNQPFNLQAGKTQEIVLKVKIPENTKEDDYYATLFFETTPGYTLSRSSAQSKLKIGSNILIAVSPTGETHRLAKIEEFAIRNSQFAIRNLVIIDSFDKPEFLLRLQNTGRSFFKPLGQISTTGWFGQKYFLDLQPENIIAGSVRILKCVDSSSGKEDRYSLPCRINSKFMIGKSTALLEFGLDKVDREYAKSINFIAVPIKLIFALLTSVIVLTTIKGRLKFNQPNALSS